MEILILILEVLCLLSLSAICSGLNVALMSLDLADLKRKARLGNIDAQRVLGLRQNAHLSLAAILLSNVAVISATSLVLEKHLGGLIAGGLSTLLIVIFGEVIPQATFARFALRFSAKLSPMLKLMILITFPISKPLQIGLDKILGDKETGLHSRHELGLIISEHFGHASSDLDEDEVVIMRGALSLSHKKVSDIMTPINKTYWLAPDTVIDDKKIDEIKTKGYSRIPILNRNKNRCFGILMIKDLLDIGFDDEHIRVDEIDLHASKTIGSKTALDTLFRKFISAHSHMMTVEQSDKIVGIVTIEDLIEEILGHEIEDESDRDRKRITKPRTKFNK